MQNPPTQSARLVLGQKVQFDRDGGELVGEVAGPPAGGQLPVRWFIGPGRSESADVPAAGVRLAPLSSQQRVYLPPGDCWRFGRLVCQVEGGSGGERTFMIALPDGVRAPLPEGQFHVHCAAAALDPLDALVARAVETPFLFEHRHRFLAALAAQRAACAGLFGLLAARVELLEHQVAAALRVMFDVRPRYLLAGGAGLGKSVEAGVVINQTFFDDEDAAVTVLAPRALVGQWSAELSSHFDLETDDEGGLQVLPFEALDKSGLAPPGLLVIDECLELLAGPPARVAAAEKLARAAPRLLLLAPPRVEGLDAERARLLGWLGDGAADRLIAPHRRGRATGTPQRSAPRDEGDLDPDNRRLTWTAFERWREVVAAQPDASLRPALVRVFAALAEAVGSWPGFARRLCAARLGGAKVPAADPDAARFAAVLAAPLLPGDEEAARLRELDSALEREAGADRIDLLVGLLRQDAKRLGKLPKTLVCVTSNAAAREAARRLRESLKLRVAELFDPGPPPPKPPAVKGKKAAPADEADAPRTPETAAEMFRSDAGCTVLVADDLARLGWNLQAAERVVHLDLPFDPDAVERRFAKIDRAARTSLKVSSVVLRSQLDDGPSYDDAWFRLLDGGLSVFTAGVGGAAGYAARELPGWVEAAFGRGAGAWDELVPAAAAAATPARESAAAANPFDAHFPAFFEGLTQYEADPQKFADTVNQYLKLVYNIDAGRFQAADGKTQARYHALNNVLLPEDWYGDIAAELVRPFVFDRTDAGREPQSQFLRLGQPLVEKLGSFAARDDRGRVFAMWRKIANFRGPALYLRLEFLVGPDTAALARGLADAGLPESWSAPLARLACYALPPRLVTVCADEQGKAITDVNMQAALTRPYDKRRDDVNLGKERSKVIDDMIGVDRWAALCATARDKGRELCLGGPAVVQAGADAAKRAADYLANRPEFADLAEQLGPILRAAVSRPSAELDAVGVLLLHSERCPMAKLEE